MSRLGFPRPAFLLFVAASGCARGPEDPFRLRLGYMANLTQPQPILGIARGTLAEALGPGVHLEPRIYNAGPPIVDGLLSDYLDAAYLGPVPTLLAHARSAGKGVRVIAGAASGGARLVVRRESGIVVPAELAGRRIAIPEHDNTQDLALRTWLRSKGLTACENGGTVEVVACPNSGMLERFRRGVIDGAWVPEPWGSQLVGEGGGRVLVDERTLWPGGEFVTAHLVVRRRLLVERPGIVRDLLRGHLEATRFALANPVETKRRIRGLIREVTGVRLRERDLDDAWETLKITDDPHPASMRGIASQALEAGILKGGIPTLEGLYDLRPLRDASGEASPAAAGPVAGSGA